MKREYSFNYQRNGKAINTNSFISYGLTSFKHKLLLESTSQRLVQSMLADKLPNSER